MRTVTLFHGTGAASAAKIAASGWNPSLPHEIIKSVCSQIGRDPDQVAQGMLDHGAYANGSHRTGFVSFATTAEMAANWAQRAPEVRWEVLNEVWNLEHPNLETIPANVPEFWAWAWPLLEPQPVVVEVEAPISVLEQRIARVVDQWLWPRLPEVEVVLPAVELEVISVTHVDRRVSSQAGAAFVEMTVDEFVEHAKAGRWGEGVPPGNPMERYWWPWSEFRSFVSADKLLKLE